MKKSQKQLVLEHLERGFSITSLEAWEKYGCSRLACIIHNLRKEGYDIEREMVCSKTKLGHDATYAVYRLKKEEVA